MTLLEPYSDPPQWLLSLQVQRPERIPRQSWTSSFPALLGTVN